MTFFPGATEHHQPASAPGHRPQNPAPQGRPSTVRVRRTINGRQQCTTTERDAPGSLPSSDEKKAAMEKEAALLHEIVTIAAIRRPRRGSTARAAYTPDI